MSESVLVVGYDYDEFRELQDAGAENGIVCDRADSPAELVRLAQAKRYNCIFCDISVLDSVPYIHAIRKIQVTPIIIGAIEECKNISIFSRYIKITDQTVAAPRLAPIKAGDLRLYPEYRFASIHEREITLTAKEFDILSLLASNPKRVFTYEMIVDLVWHEDYTFYSRKAISNHISNIKKKIRVISGSHGYIVSVYGIGYKFDPDF